MGISRCVVVVVDVTPENHEKLDLYMFDLLV